MGFELAKLFVTLEAQTRSYDAKVARSTRELRAMGDAAAKASKVEAPSFGQGQDAQAKSPTADAAGQADQLAGALIPLAGKIQSAIVGAMVPLNQFAARFGAQFERVGGTIIAISKRIDGHLKYPIAEKAVEGLRKHIQAKFGASEGYAKKFGNAVDRAFEFTAAYRKASKFFSSLGSVANKSIAGMGRVKMGNINFDNSVRSITNLNGAARAATGSIRRMGSEIAVALGFFGLVYKAVGFLKDGVKGAMDLGETMSKVATVFGDSANEVTAQAARMAKSFGLPKGAILDAAAGFGLIGKAAGMNQQAAAGLANQMSGLAADVASFYNIPMDDALAKLKSGLVGEAEPMRALGVLLDETSVAQEAFRMGLAKNKKELTQQDKVLARTSLIAKGLKDATGDLERTQSSSANQARKFAGTIQNLAASIGETMLPALTKGLNLLNEFGSFLVRSFEANKSAFEGFGAKCSETYEVVGILFRNWQATFEVARLSIQQGLINLGEYFDVLGPNISRVAEYIANNWYALIRDALHASLALLKGFFSNVQAVGAAIGRALSGQEFKVDWTPMLDGFKATAEKLPEMLKPLLTDMSAEIKKAADKIYDDELARTGKSGPIAPQKKGVLAGEGDPAAAGKSDKKSQVGDLASYASTLQEAVGGKNKMAERTAKATERIAKATEKLANRKPEAAPGFAGGPAWSTSGLA